MTITTFGTLKSAIADFLNRQDLTASIPTFVALAEAQFNRTIRDYRQITRGALTIDARIEALPADWLETIRVTVDAAPVQVLTQISLDDLTDYRQRYEDVAGVPQFFAHIGTNLEIFPTPGASYTGEITYFAKITALAADGDTNWLLTAAPDMYLYGALMHSAPYLRDDPRLAVWAGLYSQAAAELAQQSEQARFGGPLRMRIR